MHRDTREILQGLFAKIIKHNVSADTLTWLQDKTLQGADKAAELNMAFASLPRRTGKHLLELTQDELSGLTAVHPQYFINDWTVHRLCRVWLLLQIEAAEKENYFRKLENLFKAAEMNELVALYSALPGFAYAEDWQKQCAEGIRSNIGIVLEAIMYNNPYPSKYLSEAAWNQLVMKAFFTDKDVNRIIGLDDRANKGLASTLVDYAHERWAAHRSVNPKLWRLVTKFIDADNFSDIEKAFNSSEVEERKAAALAAYYSNYEPAKLLLEKDVELKSAIVENRLNWNSLSSQ